VEFQNLPPDLPVPVDDGAADHLPGRALPAIELSSTSGERVALDRLGPGRTVVYAYPRTGVPGRSMPAGWDEIPGARGCTPESCGFRDHADDLAAAGAERVYGLSSQDGAEQGELVDRLGLPFDLLCDAELRLAEDPGLPTFEAGGSTLYRRLTMVIADGVIEHVFHPVFPPDEHAAEVVAWLQANPLTSGS